MSYESLIYESVSPFRFAIKVLRRIFCCKNEQNIAQSKTERRRREMKKDNRVSYRAKREQKKFNKTYRVLRSVYKTINPHYMNGLTRNS